MRVFTMGFSQMQFLRYEQLKMKKKIKIITISCVKKTIPYNLMK